jgi:hypothetical protein
MRPVGRKRVMARRHYPVKRVHTGIATGAIYEQKEGNNVFQIHFYRNYSGCHTPSR